MKGTGGEGQGRDFGMASIQRQIGVERSIDSKKWQRERKQRESSLSRQRNKVSGRKHPTSEEMREMASPADLNQSGLVEHCSQVRDTEEVAWI